MPSMTTTHPSFLKKEIVKLVEDVIFFLGGIFTSKTSP